MSYGINTAISDLITTTPPVVKTGERGSAQTDPKIIFESDHSDQKHLSLRFFDFKEKRFIPWTCVAQSPTDYIVDGEENQLYFLKKYINQRLIILSLRKKVKIDPDCLIPLTWDKKKFSSKNDRKRAKIAHSDAIALQFSEIKKDLKNYQKGSNWSLLPNENWGIPGQPRLITVDKDKNPVILSNYPKYVKLLNKLREILHLKIPSKESRLINNPPKGNIKKLCILSKSILSNHEPSALSRSMVPKPNIALSFGTGSLKGDSSKRIIHDSNRSSVTSGSVYMKSEDSTPPLRFPYGVVPSTKLIQIPPPRKGKEFELLSEDDICDNHLAKIGGGLPEGALVYKNTTTGLFYTSQGRAIKTTKKGYMMTLSHHGNFFFEVWPIAKLKPKKEKAPFVYPKELTEKAAKNEGLEPLLESFRLIEKNKLEIQQLLITKDDSKSESKNSDIEGNNFLMKKVEIAESNRKIRDVLLKNFLSDDHHSNSVYKKLYEELMKFSLELKNCSGNVDQWSAPIANTFYSTAIYREEFDNQVLNGDQLDIECRGIFYNRIFPISFFKKYLHDKHEGYSPKIKLSIHCYTQEDQWIIGNFIDTSAILSTIEYERIHTKDSFDKYLKDIFKDSEFAFPSLGLFDYLTRVGTYFGLKRTGPTRFRYNYVSDLSKDREKHRMLSFQ